MASTATTASTGHGPGATRRDFLFIATATVGAVGAAAALVPLVDQMNPDASTLAAGGPVDLDVSKIEENAQVMIRWRQRPIFVFHRSKQTLDSMQSQQMISLLSDPNSEQTQQPPYAANWHRSIKPEYGILVGICTHLGCIPLFYPTPSADDAGVAIGPAAISAPVTARNTIRPAACFPACRRRIIFRCRPIASSTPRRCASARTIRAPRPGISIRYASFSPNPSFTAGTHDGGCAFVTYEVSEGSTILADRPIPIIAACHCHRRGDRLRRGCLPRADRPVPQRRLPQNLQLRLRRQRLHAAKPVGRPRHPGSRHRRAHRHLPDRQFRP